jgi:predicted nucleic acid-binding protein
LLVLDASAALAAFLGTGVNSASIRVRIEAPGESLHAPHLLDVEMLHALRGLVLRGDVSRARSEEVREDFASLRWSRYSHVAFLDRIWELKDNLTAYDAAYVALAETLSAPLITTDARLARASGIRAEVEVYG